MDPLAIAVFGMLAVTPQATVVVRGAATLRRNYYLRPSGSRRTE
jgi:hypothetical protein